MAVGSLFGITISLLASSVEMLFGTEQLSWMLEECNSSSQAFTAQVEAEGGWGHPGPGDTFQSSQVALCLTPLKDIDCQDQGKVRLLTF